MIQHLPSEDRPMHTDNQVSPAGDRAVPTHRGSWGRTVLTLLIILLTAGGAYLAGRGSLTFVKSEGGAKAATDTLNALKKIGTDTAAHYNEMLRFQSYWALASPCVSATSSSSRGRSSSTRRCRRRS